MIIFQSDNRVQVVIEMTPEEVASAPACIHEVVSGLMESRILSDKARDGVIFLLQLLDQMMLNESQVVASAKALAES